MKRRCGCGGAAVAVETSRMAGIAIADRFECPDCTTRFDVPSPLGSVLLGGLAAFLALYVWTAPLERFARGDRPWILGLVSLVAAAMVGVVVRGTLARRRHPPI